MTLIATQPHLGLVCITVSKEVRYRTITRKRLLDLSEEGQQRALEDIYRDNIQTLDNALRYCEREGIKLYRMPSSIAASGW
jgi:UV DNA damage endonuclease